MTEDPNERLGAKGAAEVKKVPFFFVYLDAGLQFMWYLSKACAFTWTVICHFCAMYELHLAGLEYKSVSSFADHLLTSGILFVTGESSSFLQGHQLGHTGQAKGIVLWPSSILFAQ